MSDFSKGIDYAFEFIEKNIIGRVVNGTLVGIITREELENLKKTIPRKCDFCTKPCGETWCNTIKDK